MENFILEATRSTPAVHFDTATLVLEIKGESYPENAAKFFGPMFEWVTSAMALGGTAPVVMNLELAYFNSSSSKILFNLFDILDKAAAAGRTVTINWRYLEENEMALECGEEFQNEVENAVFNLVPLGA
jgi:hypothetical protein